MNYLWDVLGNGEYRFDPHSVIAIVAKGENSTVVYLSGAAGGLEVRADAGTVNASYDEYISNAIAESQHAHVEQLNLPEGFNGWTEDDQVEYLNNMLDNNTEGEN